MSWYNNYVGTPYSKKQDCGWMVEKIQGEVFNRDFTLPARQKDYSQQITDIKDEYVIKTNTPDEGDLVLTITANGKLHLGIFLIINNRMFVIHNYVGAKQTIITAISKLSGIGLTLEGYYTWK